MDSAMIDTLIYATMLVGCGYIIGNLLGYRDGMRDAKEIYEEE